MKSPTSSRRLPLLLLLLPAAHAAPQPPPHTAPQPPPHTDKPSTARWLAKTLDWGVLSTLSVHLRGAPFGNPASFAADSSGALFFYVSSLDTSMQDVQSNATVSFTLSLAAAPGHCAIHGAATNASVPLPDPESPLCDRLTFTGQMRKLTSAVEIADATTTLFTRHPAMKSWPKSHDFYFTTIDLTDLWLIDFFGGASLITPDAYYAASPTRS